MYLFYYIRAFTFFSKEKKKKKKTYRRSCIPSTLAGCKGTSLHNIISHMKKNLVKPKWYFIHDFGNSIVDENEK
jgi:hypothetical protein